MPELRDTAICLRCWDWSETSQTVALFTRDTGILRGLAKGSRRERSSFSGGLEPLTLGAIRAYPKSNSDLATLASWDLLEPWRGIRQNLHAHYAACYVIDVIYHAMAPEDPHPGLFETTRAALDAFNTPDAGASALDVSLLMFHAWLLHDLGYRPDLGEPGGPAYRLDDSEAARGPHTADRERPMYFLPSRGVLVPDDLRSRARESWAIRPRTCELLRRIFADVDARTPEHAPDVAPADTGPKDPLAEGQSLSPWLLGTRSLAWAGVEADDVARAARFLTSYTGVTLGRVVPSLRFVYPDCPDRIADWLPN